MRLLSTQATSCRYRTNQFESGVGRAISLGCGTPKDGTTPAVLTPASLKVPGPCGSPNSTLLTTYQHVVQLGSSSSSTCQAEAGFDLTKELSTLRRDLEVERSRSRAVAERLRSDLHAIDAEIRSSSSSTCPANTPNEVEESSMLSTSAELPLIAAKLGSDASTAADGTQSEAEQTAAAIALAHSLHDGVRSLMQQGMEFRALAVRREASLKAALEQSERARLQAEEQTVSWSDPAYRGNPPPIREEEINLAIAEQEICEALVGRLQAQVRTLEMQVECMDCELKAAKGQAAEWEHRHKTAMVTIKQLQNDEVWERVVEPHEMSFKQRRALFQKGTEDTLRQQPHADGTEKFSAEPENRSIGSLASPPSQCRSDIERCGVEGHSLSPSPSSPLNILGSRTPPMMARPFLVSSSQTPPSLQPLASTTPSLHRPGSQSPGGKSLQQPSWTVAATRPALCAEVRQCSPLPSPTKEAPPSDAISAATKKSLVEASTGFSEVSTSPWASTPDSPSITGVASSYAEEE